MLPWETVLEAQAALSLRASQTTAKTWPSVPSSYVAFCLWLGVALSPAQTVVGKVAYDGAEPCELVGEERELARTLFGAEVETIPAEARGVLVAKCGGRGGKTYALIALKLVHGMLTRDLSPLAPGQRAFALVIAPNDALRQEAVNYALGAVRSKPELLPFLVLPKGTKESDQVSTFGLERPDFKRVVQFMAGVATVGGYGGRGKGLTDFAMDEAAFFRDAGAKVNDVAVFAGASPRVLPGGMSIVASTPWGEMGLLYDMFSRNHNHPTDAIAAHAPTLLLNPSPWAQTIVAREYKRDPDNARREFGAEFMTAGTTKFFDRSTLDANVWEPSGFALQPGDVVFGAGGDMGLRRNSSALVISVLRAGIVLAGVAVLELKPQPGKPLKPSEVSGAFVTEMQRWGCGYMVGDGHYRDTLVEAFGEAGLVFVDAPNDVAEPFIALRNRLREGTVKLPAPVPQEPTHVFTRLRRQMDGVLGIPHAGGRISIVMPPWATGEHGDIVSALVLSILHGAEVPKAAVVDGSAEWEQQQRELRQQAVRDQAGGKQSDRGQGAFWRRR